jgi:hypothetical protein
MDHREKKIRGQPVGLRPSLFSNRKTCYAYIYTPSDTNTRLYMDVSRHILVFRYINIETGISDRREYINKEYVQSASGRSKAKLILK